MKNVFELLNKKTQTIAGQLALTEIWNFATI